MLNCLSSGNMQLMFKSFIVDLNTRCYVHNAKDELSPKKFPLTLYVLNSILP